MAAWKSFDAKEWRYIDWKTARSNVRILQMRIAKAFMEGKPGKVKALCGRLHRYGKIQTGTRNASQTSHRKVPRKEGALALVQEAGRLIRKYQGAPTPALIKRLNQTLRGLGNYHRFAVSSRAYRLVDTYVYYELRRMVRRRHRNKSARRLYRRYWSASGKSRTFSVEEVSGKTNKPRTYRLTKLSEIVIQRYVKIRAHANPYT